MDIPKGFKPKHGVDKKTKDLLEGKFKKIEGRIIPQVFYAYLTLEELERTKSVEDSLISVGIGFEDGDYKYTLNFFPHYYGDCSMMQLEQTRGDSLNDIAKIALYIALYYENTSIGKAFSGYHGNRTINMFPPPPRLGLDEIIYGFNLLSDGELKFKDVLIMWARFKNVDSLALNKLKLPESKIGEKTPGY